MDRRLAWVAGAALAGVLWWWAGPDPVEPPPGPSALQLPARPAMPRTELYRRIAAPPVVPAASNGDTSRAIFLATRKLPLDQRRAIREGFERALDLDPGNVHAASALADHLLGDGDLDGARELAETCLVLDPDDEVCHRTLVASFTLQGDFDGAWPYVLDCLDRDLTATHCLSAYVTLSVREGDLDEAAAAAEALGDLDEEGVWYPLAQGMVLAARGDDEGAAAYFEAACERGQPFACTEAERHRGG